MALAWRRFARALARGFRAATARTLPPNAWRDFALETGFRYSGSPGGAERLEGEVGKYAVAVAKTSRSLADSEIVKTNWELDSRGRIPRELGFGREPPLVTALGFRDIRTGDAAFDAAARVSGPSLAATAFLRAAERRTIAAALARGYAIEGGRLRRTTDGKPESKDVLRAAIDEMAALADSLSMSAEEIPGRLLENVRSDPVTAVRGRSLGALLAFHGSRPETEAAARAAISDASAGMRVAAAEALGGEAGFETLVAVALGEAQPEDQRARAIVALGRLFPAAARPRIEALAASAGIAPGVAEAIAIALREIGEPAGERAALALLAFPDERVALAAARALGAIGGRDAVLPLLELAKRRLPLGALRTVALEATRSIQARLGPAERGSLAVAEAAAAAGALSESDDAGRLSAPGDTAPPPHEPRGGG